ncbi:TauD/TfdA family dioxygenase [Hydrogenophaga sp.]|uniref:TauD/TfdA family dioxygenase n=1 Tax=Hydrogenophaga sp. TaxID=1904254 RepID=UPI00391AE859
MITLRRPAAVLGKPVVDPAAWQGADLEQNQSWLYPLESNEIDALLAMAKSVRPLIGNDPNGLLKLGKDAFKLGVFEKRLEEIWQQLKDGLGVALIRGLPLAEMERIDAASVYWGIGRHLGEARSNNPDGDMLGHVTDLGKTQDDPNSRGYQTSEAMDYHCDQCSIVGLLCVREPQSGGKSKIASSISIYNELLKRNPAAVEVLSKPLCWTKHGEINPGESSFYQSAVFNVIDDVLCTSFGPKHIEKGHKLPGAPEMTDEQRQAISLAEKIAEEQHYAMQLQQGDIQLVNNYVALHTRTAYKDWPEPERKRLLYRLWLSAPELRPATDYVNEWDAGVLLDRTNERIIL